LPWNDKSWFSSRQYLVVATGHMQLILGELAKSKKNLCAAHSTFKGHSRALPCLDLAYSTANTSTLLRFWIC